MQTPVISFSMEKFFLLILIFALFMHILTKNSSFYSLTKEK